MASSLSTKLLVAFLALSAAFGLLAVFSVRAIGEVGSELRRLGEAQRNLAHLVGQIETLEQSRIRDLRRALAEPDPRAQELILRVSHAYFPEVLRGRFDQVRALAGPPPPKSADGRAAFFRALLAHLDRLAAAHERLEDLTQALRERASRGEALDAQAADIDREEQRLRGELYDLNREIDEETQRINQRAERDERSASFRVALVALLTLLVGGLVWGFTSRALAPIPTLVEYARAISRGDYGRPAPEGASAELSALALELGSMARFGKEREDELERQRVELERAYHRVAHLSQYHQSVVESLRTAIWVADQAGLVSGENRAAVERFGSLRGRSLLATPFSATLAEDGRLDALLAAAEPRSFGPVTVQDRTYELTVAPFLGEGPERLVVAIEDVTEAARTKAALIRSERLAAIGRMSAHVTHEIRNPLASIGLNAEQLETLLAESIPSGAAAADEARTLCQAIGREIDRLSAITEEYLRFARLPRPELAVEDLRSHLAAIAAFVRGDLARAKVTLHLELDDPLPELPMDADQMRQAILNLIRNAKEAMPSGGTLTIAARARPDDVEIEVADTGVGIEPVDLPRIFDPFFSTKATGTGLGLAVTQEIVAEHGGDLEVRSERQRGTRVLVRLPRSLGSRQDRSIRASSNP